MLLTVDTLRADRLGAYGSDRGLTPRLDALAAESSVFEAAYAPASFTLPSVTTLLTGRYPEEVGMLDNKSVLSDAVPTLATELRARGWNTAAVVSNFVLRRASGLADGFSDYDDAFTRLEAGRNMPERGARRTTDALLRALDGCTRGEDWRCFLWGHYQDPHGPYTPPRDLRQRLLEAEREAPGGRRTLPVRKGPAGIGAIPGYQYIDGQHEVAFYRAGYHGEIVHTDEEIGRFLDALAERGWLDEALLVFAADHGEGLGESNYWFSHGRMLSDPLVRVPLFLRVPGRAPERRGDLVSLVDLFPTLMALVTGEEVDGHVGRNLLAPGAEAADGTVYLAALGGAPVPRFGLMEGKFKFVMSERDGAWREQLFVRGHEAANIAGGAPEETRAMRAKLEAFRARLDAGARASAQELSDEDRERLRALGYGE